MLTGAPPSSISRSPKPCSNNQSPVSLPKMMLALNSNLNRNPTNRKIRKIVVVAQNFPSVVAQDDASMIVCAKIDKHTTACSKYKGKKKMDARGFACGGGKGVKGA
ncbi:DEAD-box ATP-dependent RNA helicase 28 [Pyrus ussuriensis x Pyrus communis]|uniref:DEAD-box ATP-dependent RNA helicase 28 n=1 Tax=Pyrus ussuriensis x Pyrus communis TaxID=2448454 RepID=A0A5N5GUT6_9ROSA|nr:DEAD-box ATP-dependent RNA helicase 28 [Pyrus ussuriensis x Pyrus communis]